MANPSKVVMKIISVKGTCAAKHQVGQEFDLSGISWSACREIPKRYVRDSFMPSIPIIASCGSEDRYLGSRIQMSLMWRVRTPTIL
jgi:uncharacterized repeat protein (TIGR04076 family)